MSSTVPKAVLYYSPASVWSSVVLLTLEEKGYGHDEVDLKLVDLDKAENFDPTFLRLNPNGTVPTLIVPLAKTLSEEVESRYKAITSPKAIVAFLDESRSPLSRTHTTSAAPAPALSPATIAFTETSKIIIDELLHSVNANPTTLLHYSATDESSLQQLSRVLLPALTSKRAVIDGYLSDTNLTVTEKVRKLWTQKKADAESLLEVLKSAETPAASLDATQAKRREDYFAIVNTLWNDKLKALLLLLDKEIIGPYALGDQLSLADLHLGGWLARVLLICGAKDTETGSAAIAKLEARFEGGLGLPQAFKPTDRDEAQTKFAAFWDVMRVRNSWKKVFAHGSVAA